MESNATSNGTTVGGNNGHLKREMFILSLLIVGVAGNFSALLILLRKKYSNSKYTLMLKYLLTNNLIGILGLLTQNLLKLYLGEGIKELPIASYNCAGYIIWRFFGLSSGCIAVVMAIERWMALARPFTYHKHITNNIIKIALKFFIFLALVITILPLFGIGLYDFNPQKKTCERYRDAVDFIDVGYAYLFMIFGIALCVVIVVFNLFVARVLFVIGNSKTTTNYNYNVVSGAPESSSTLGGGSLKRNEHNSPPFLHSNSVQSQRSNPSSQSDEIKFAKLMTVLSCSFVICWMPQMISTLLRLTTDISETHFFLKISDIFLLLHFIFDPFIYVLSRRKTPSYFKLNLSKLWKKGLKRTSSDQSRRRTEETFDMC